MKAKKQIQKTGKKVINFVMWLVGLVVIGSIGFAMIGGTLALPAWLGGPLSSVIAGWIVLVGAGLGVVVKLLTWLFG